MSAHPSHRAHAPRPVSPLQPEPPARWWLFPTTRLGGWSLGLLAAFFACLLGFRAIQILGDPLGGGKETFWERPTFALLAVAAAVFGSAAGPRSGGSRLPAPAAARRTSASAAAAASSLRSARTRAVRASWRASASGAIRGSAALAGIVAPLA